MSPCAEVGLPSKCRVGHTYLVTSKACEVKQVLVDGHPLRDIPSRMHECAPVISIHIRIWRI